MKCTSQRLRKDGDVIFIKVSRAARHQFIWVRVRVRVRVRMDYTHLLTKRPILSNQGVEPTFKPLNLSDKMQNKRFCGTDRGMVDSYLCEFMWTHEYKENDLFMQILNNMNEFLPLNKTFFSLKSPFCLIFWVALFYKRSLTSFKLIPSPFS